MEPLPAGARTPPAPPRPPAPPTTGWLDRPGGSAPRPPTRRAGVWEFLRQCLGELRKVDWSSRQARAHNSILVFLVLTVLVLLLGAMQLTTGMLGRGLLG